MSELQSWYYGLPSVTKWFFTLSAATTLLGALGVLSYDRMIFAIDPIFREFQIWRILSPFLFHFLSIQFAISMMFLLRFGQNLERVKFAGRSADFLWMLMLCGFLLMIPGYYFNIRLLGESLIMSVIYLWARYNADTTVSFMFGLQFKAKYLPWAMVAFTALVGANPVAELFGIIAGHIYFLLSELVPRDYGVNIVKTPTFISTMFFDEAPVYAPQQGQQMPPPDAGFRGPRYSWGGGGNRLGN